MTEYKTATRESGRSKAPPKKTEKDALSFQVHSFASSSFQLLHPVHRSLSSENMLVPALNQFRLRCIVIVLFHAVRT